MKLILEIDPDHVDAELLTRIGYELECGGTFQQDPLMAVRAYDTAAACPDGGLAANNLGWMFLKGKGVAQDTEKALALFRNAAERGNCIAMVNLGNYYEFAEEQDDKQAVYWYRKAADSGDEKGLFNYANMLHHGRGIRRNRKKAFSIFSNLYAHGYRGTAFYMGLYYQNGDVVKQDYQKAREYYRIGALEDDRYCLCQLGVLYAQGHGVPKDHHAAFDYYSQAAKLGDALACANLGYCYEVGQGVVQDVAIAKNYYRCAAEHGEQHAAAALKRLEDPSCEMGTLP